MILILTSLYLILDLYDPQQPPTSALLMSLRLACDTRFLIFPLLTFTFWQKPSILYILLL